MDTSGSPIATSHQSSPTTSGSEPKCQVSSSEKPFSFSAFIGQLGLEPTVRALFNEYLVVLNARIVEKKLPKATRPKVIGAILTKYLLAHREEIMDAYAQIRIEGAVGTTIAALRDAGLPEVASTLATSATYANQTKNP